VETKVALMEMKKRSQSLRKKILVAIKLCNNALHLGKLENFSLRPSEEVFNICNRNSFWVKILHILQRKQYVQREQHRYQYFLMILLVSQPYGRCITLKLCTFGEFLSSWI
jgi:hypothetical protein